MNQPAWSSDPPDHIFTVDYAKQLATAISVINLRHEDELRRAESPVDQRRIRAEWNNEILEVCTAMMSGMSRLVEQAIRLATDAANTNPHPPIFKKPTPE